MKMKLGLDSIALTGRASSALARKPEVVAPRRGFGEGKRPADAAVEKRISNL
jgi:hypothetical protein